MKETFCIDCGKIISRYKLRCKSCAGKGSLNHNWKGGKLKRRGYVYIKCPHHPRSNNWGFILETHLVMEKKIGRFLKYYSKGNANNEVVHHKNGIKDDNRIENLELMKHSEHMRLHRIGKIPANKGKKVPEEMKERIRNKMQKVVKNRLRDSHGRFIKK